MTVCIKRYRIRGWLSCLTILLFFIVLDTAPLRADADTLLVLPGLRLESVEGRSTNLDKNFFERVQDFSSDHYLRDLGSSVGRLEAKFREDSKWYGAHCTASLISERYVLTAHHCVKSSPDIEELRVRFGYLSENLANVGQETAFEYVQSADGERVLAADRTGGKISLLDGRTGAPLVRFYGHVEKTTYGALSRSGDLAALIDTEGRISIWSTDVEATHVRRIRRAFRELTDIESQGASRPFQEDLVEDLQGASELDRLLQVRIAKTRLSELVGILRSPLHELPFVEGGFKHAVFGVLEGESTDTLATSENRKAIVWDAVSGEELLRVEIERDSVAALIQDGKRQMIAFPGHRLLSDVAISPTGEFAAFGATDGTIFVYDLMELRQVHAFEGHTGRIKALGFDQTGRILISVGHDRSSRQWNISTGLQEIFSRTWILDAIPIEYSPIEELDYAILEIVGDSSSLSPTRFYEPLKLFPAAPVPGEELLVLHHPEGQNLRATQSKCRVIELSHSDLDRIAETNLVTAALAHRCDTRPGSSGAPIFNEKYRLAIGIHHAGVGRLQNNFAKRLDVIISQSSILRQLQFNARPPTEEEQARLDIETRFLTDAAIGLVQEGANSKAIGLARYALPNEISKPNRPYVQEALDALYLAWSTRREMTVFGGQNTHFLEAIELSDRRILCFGLNGEIVIFGSSGELNSILSGHQGRVLGVYEMSNGTILSWSTDRTVRVWQNGKSKLVQMQWQSYAGDIATPRELFELEDGRIFVWGGISGGILGPTHEWDVILSGHRQSIIGALQLEDGRLLTWGGEGTAKIWGLDGAEIVRFSEHTTWINGGLQLANGNLLTWTNTDEARLWRLDGTQLAVMSFPGEDILGAHQLIDGSLVTWSDNQYSEGSFSSSQRGEKTFSLRIWSDSGSLLADFIGHEGRILGVTELNDHRILTWSEDGSARVWNIARRSVIALNGHTDKLNGAMELDGQIFTWSNDNTLRVWTSTGAHVAVLAGHDAEVLGAKALSDGRLMSWSNDFTVRLWAMGDVPGTRIVEGASDSRAIQLQDGRLLTWSWSGNAASLRDPDGTLTKRLVGHDAGILGARELRNGRLMTWGWDATARLWSSRGEAIGQLLGHPYAVYNAVQLQNGNLITISQGPHLRIWDTNGGEIGVAEATFLLELSDGSLLLSNGETANLFGQDGKRLSVFSGHTGSIDGALELSNGNLATWARDQTARIWKRDGTQVAVLEHCLSEDLVPMRVNERDPLSGSTRVQLRSDCIIWGGLEAHGGRLVTWGDERTAQIWESDGSKGPELVGHCPLPIESDLNCSIKGTIELRDHRILTWSSDGTARIWSPDGTPRQILRGHCQSPWTKEHCEMGADELSDGRIVTWSNDHDIVIWRGDGTRSAVLSGHCSPPNETNSNCNIDGVLELSDGQLLSWSDDGTLRIWPTDVSEFFNVVDSTLDILKPLSRIDLCKYRVEEEQNCS